MNGIKTYEKFCNRIFEAALNREKIGITIECNGMSCYGMFRVEPIQEDEVMIEIIAGDMDIIFEKSPALFTTYDESSNTYTISNGEFRCVFA